MSKQALMIMALVAVAFVVRGSEASSHSFAYKSDYATNDCSGSPTNQEVWEIGVCYPDVGDTATTYQKLDSSLKMTTYSDASCTTESFSQQFSDTCEGNTKITVYNAGGLTVAANSVILVEHFGNTCSLAHPTRYQIFALGECVDAFIASAKYEIKGNDVVVKGYLGPGCPSATKIAEESRPLRTCVFDDSDSTSNMAVGPGMVVQTLLSNSGSGYTADNVPFPVGDNLPLSSAHSMSLHLGTLVGIAAALVFAMF